MSEMDNARIQTMRWDASQGIKGVVLSGFFPTGHACDWAIDGTLGIGRMGSGMHIEIPSGVVSARHGQIGVVEGRVFYRDLGSTNGTLLDGEPVTGTVELRRGSVLSFAPKSAPQEAVFYLALLEAGESELAWQQVPFGEDVQEVVLGRAAGGVTLDDPYASERHVSFFRSSKGLFALDLMSTNGIWVNGEREAGSAPLPVPSVVQVGLTWVVVLDGALWVGSREHLSVDEPVSWEQTEAVAASVAANAAPVVAPAAQGTPVTQVAPEAHVQPAQQPAAPVAEPVVPAAKPAAASTSAVPEHAASPRTDTLRIDIEEKNVWSRLKKKTILRDVHLTVEPGELVLILGGSGAGKSTFINAVMGNDKAEGTIRLGDRDVYEEYERIKYQIGYVPQQDLLRGNDTVRDTLMAAAQLRMPANTPRAECAARAQWAGELLGLKREGDTLAGRLSGGQRKRLSIAIELVGGPTLFFLDEPDSGLDGIMSRTLMENLRDIADLGKIVMVITHGPDRAADLFSKVIVLAKAERDGAGHLLFCGPVDEAKQFFETDTLEGIVRRINRPDEGGEGLADAYLDKWEGQ